MPKVELGELFGGLQQVLNAKLNNVRSVVNHKGAMGTASEVHWQAMLVDFLPARYQVTTGFVVDSTGATSDQIDIIIHDRQYSPFILHHDGAHHVPAESVYAILECKQDISKENLEYAGKKAASVRALKRTSLPIAHAGGVYSPKPPGPILAGLCTLSSAWSPALGDSFTDNLAGLSGDEIIDLGCVLTHGAFQRTNDGTISNSTSDTALVWFCVTLVSRLQALGTVPALDLQAYLYSITASKAYVPKTD